MEPTKDEHVPLAWARLIKAKTDDDESSWTLKGIASDEETDTEGEQLLKSILDLSYAKQRGYVNWHHSREPADQLGFITKCDLIPREEIPALEKACGVKLSPTASVYFEADLYRHVRKAQEVRDVVRSAPPGYHGLGVSLDGGIAKEKASGTLLKAYVRGVAISPMPVHTKTLVTLAKALARGSGSARPLSHDEAVLFVLKKQPAWSYAMAERVVAATEEMRRRTEE